MTWAGSAAALGVALVVVAARWVGAPDDEALAVEAGDAERG